jgi:flavorubredoxin
MMEMLQAQFSEVKTELTKKEQLLINVSTDNKEMMPTMHVS